MFVAAAALAYGLIGRGWFSIHEERFSADGGPVWSTICTSFDSDDGMKCETHTFLSGEGGHGLQWILSLMFVLTGLTAMVMSGIAGIFLLKKPRSLLSILTLCFAGTSFLIIIGQLLYGASKGGFHLPGHGFFIYLIGAITAIVGGIMGMVRKSDGQPAGGVRPGYGYPPGQGYPNQGYGNPNPYGPQPGPAYAQPQGAPPQGSPYAPGGAPQQAYSPAPQQPAAQAGPPHTCGTPTTWVAQYNRWFCTRCNQYI